VTSYKELYKDALEIDRHNGRNPDQKSRQSYLVECLGDAAGPVVAASDYVKALPLLLGQYLPHGLVALGTDGFGRSDDRGPLRDFFEVDARHIALYTLSEMARRGEIEADTVIKARDDWTIDPDKVNPLYL